MRAFNGSLAAGRAMGRARQTAFSRIGKGKYAEMRGLTSALMLPSEYTDLRSAVHAMSLDMLRYVAARAENAAVREEVKKLSDSHGGRYRIVADI